MDGSRSIQYSQQCSQPPEPETPVRHGHPTHCQESVQEQNINGDVLATPVPMDVGISRPARTHVAQESSTVLRDRMVPSIGAGTGVPASISDAKECKTKFAYLTSFGNHPASLLRPKKERTPDYESLVNENDILHYNISSPVGFTALFCNDRKSALDRKPLPVFKDLKLMSDALHCCDWRVQLFPPHPSMSLDECKERLKDIVQGNYNSFSCFMFYYSGHGTAKGLLLSDGCCMPYCDIVRSITSNNSLDGKPKIFVFDSCREVPSKPKEKHSLLKNIFHKEKVENETDSSMCAQNSLPADTLICFSTNEGTESFSGDITGSFFTVRLSKLLQKFWRKLTFTEIVTLAHGWTAKLAQIHNREQQPVMENALTRLLLFDAYLFHGQQAQSPFNTSSEFVASKTIASKTIVSKGPECQEIPNEFFSDVETDAIGKRLEFKTKDDVTSNLHRLGQGITVFVCYTPDPDSPYYDPKDREEVIAHNQIQIISLIHDLEQCGFTVISDLHLGNTQPSNRLMWYVSRIELCDFLVMVCSPSFKELFSRVELKGKIIDERSSWFRTYCASIYSEIHKEGKKSAFCSKFLPVILDNRFSVDDCIPTLLAAGSRYQLEQSSPRNFEYESNGEWEQLVCRMAGIDRIKLNAPIDRGVHKLAAPYSQGSSHKSAPKNTKLRRGHKALQWAPPSTTEQNIPPLPPPQSRPAPHVHPMPPTKTTLPPISPVQPPQPADLPNEPPADSVILWLCDKITEWKFFARYLKMDNSEVEKIAADHRDSIREQRYHMFESWKRHEWSEYTYRTLGDVLLKSESNRPLYKDFCLEVEEVEGSH